MSEIEKTTMSVIEKITDIYNTSKEYFITHFGVSGSYLLAREFNHLKTIFKHNKDFLDYPAKEVSGVLLSTVTMGLTLNPAAKEIYIHCRKISLYDKQTKQKTFADILIMTPTTNGLMALHKRMDSDFVGCTITHIRKGDKFNWHKEEIGRIINYEPNLNYVEDKNNPFEDLLFVYVELRYKSGVIICDRMSTSDILKRRKVSSGWDRNASKPKNSEHDFWVNYPKEMADKTVLKRVLDKRVPKNSTNPEITMYLNNEHKNNTLETDFEEVK